MLKEMYEMGKRNKKAQGLAFGVVSIAVAAVVGIILTQVYNSVLNGALAATAANGMINGTSKTVYANVPVFIGLGILVAAATGFFVSRQ